MGKSIVMQWRQAQGECFSVSVAGDFCPREAHSGRIAANAADIVREIRPFYAAADLRLLQWETAITEKDTPIIKSGPNLRCPKEALNFAEALGVQVNLLANNHTGDYGPDAVMETIAACHERNFATVGAGKDIEDSRKALILDVKGFKVAIINCCEHEFGCATAERSGVNGMEPVKVARQIKELKSDGCTVLVTLHGGHEWFPFPSPRMVELFRFFADAGADAVFNCHTHCPLGCEIYNGVPVIGSPGNFFFPARSIIFENAAWHLGYLPVMSFDEKGAYKLEITPYLNLEDGIKLLDEQEFADFEKHFEMLKRPYQDEKFCREMFDSWCVVSGLQGYFHNMCGVKVPEDWCDPEIKKDFMAQRNLFNCEAHNDLLRNAFCLVEEQRVSQAYSRIDLLRSMQVPGWLIAALKRRV